MGLDQYAYAVNDRAQKAELAYWRKHNRLQGWMEALWASKGNSGVFNCVDVELTEDDLSALEQDIAEMRLPYTTGFFFGTDSYGDSDSKAVPYDDFETDRKFIADARRALREGRKVFYTSWW